MNAQELLVGLRRRSLVVKAEGGQLMIGPSPALTDIDRRAIRLHKPELIALLSPDPLADFETRLFDAAAKREWVPTLAWSDVPPGATVPLWCEEWEQPDYTSWAHAPCLPTLEEPSRPKPAEYFEAALELIDDTQEPNTRGA